MVRNDAEVVFQQLKELDMVGKGWIWIGSDKSTTSVFDDATNLQDAMQGVIGIHPSRKSKFFAAFFTTFFARHFCFGKFVVERFQAVHQPILTGQ